MARNQQDNRLRTRGDDFGIRDIAEEGVAIVAEASLDALQRKLNARIYDVEALRADVRVRGGLFGFGRRQVVPADQVHVVSGYGIHSNPAFLKRETEVFGVAASRPSVYWMNGLTQVVALRTITFVVPVAGATNIGVDVLDANRVPYNVTAHVVAKLDEEQSLLAAQRVGNDIYGLAATIREVTEAQLLDAAAKLSLTDVINNRQILAENARDAVNHTLDGLGYELVFITIAELGGEAYDKLVRQAQASVTRDTTIAINAAELATGQDVAQRERTEATVNAQTRQETEAKRLTAEEAIALAEASKAENVAKRQHELDLANVGRDQAKAERDHELALRQVQLTQAQTIAQTEAEAQQELLRQQREKERELEAAKADATRQELEQQRRLAREAEKVREDAQRLLEEKQAEAERAKVVQITGANAQAEALLIETQARTDAELKTATARAMAAQKQAEADVKTAEGTRAREAAQGLAAADVEERRVAIAEKQVAVERAKGLAAAEVAKQQAEAEIQRAQGLLEVELQRQRELAKLFDENPTLVDLEKMKLGNAHELQMEQVRTAAQVQMMQVMAPQMDLNFNIIGDGGRASQVMAQVMAIATGAQMIADTNPMVGRLIGTSNTGSGTNMPDLGSLLTKVLPTVQSVVSQMQPTIFSTLTVAGLVEAITPALTGQADVVETINSLKEQAGFRMIADIPVAGILRQFGIGTQATPDNAGMIR